MLCSTKFCSLLRSITMIGLALFLSSAQAVPESVTIGYIPGENSTIANALGDELATLIEKHSGQKIKTFVAKSHSELIQGLSEKKVDFAFLSALAFVEAEKKVELKVLLKKVWEQGFYYSVWLTNKSSKLRKISDLRGKRIAFVDESSASGFLYPREVLIEKGFDFSKDFKKVVFTGSHERSVDLLKAGEVDAIAVFANDKQAKESAWTRRGEKSQTVRVLWVGDAIPNDPFSVRKEFYDLNPKKTHDLMFGLIEMNEDKKSGPELRRLLGVSSLMLATSQQYEPVRKLFQIIKNRETQQ